MNAFAKAMMVTNHTVNCEMRSLPDTLQILLAGYTFMALSMASETMAVGLPDIA